MRHLKPVPLALIVLLLATTASSQSAPPGRSDPNAEVKTLKERLSDKASDEQRVDNCRVPADQRGPVPRPGCPGEAPVAAAAKKP